MKSLLPDSISGRIMLVLLVGLTLSHLLSTMVYSTGHPSVRTETDVQRFAERTAAAARLLDRAGSESVRRDLATALDGSGLHLHWPMKTPPTPGKKAAANTELEAVRAALEEDFGLLGGDRLLKADAPDHKPGIALRLGDGSWALFSPAQEPPPLLSPHAVLSTLIMAIGVILFSVWATRWIGQPLAIFADAADRLGRDVNAPPLPPGGPREVRRAASAFNEMQNRIRRFVEDRTRMLAAISHDLRSPITRLRLRAEMLPDDEARARMLADLADMESMVTSTLDFARGEERTETVQTTDLAATLETICDAAADIGLAADYAWSGRLLCVCRPLALKRALTNLIENAARYGGKARVHAERKGDAIRVTIEDNGPGIPEEAMEKVFTPFFRLEQSRNRKTGGMGLGMTVARTVIRAHGGDIRLDNRPEGGLTVVVTLPQGRSGA